jgi:hypothetical protein
VAFHEQLQHSRIQRRAVVTAVPTADLHHARGWFALMGSLPVGVNAGRLEVAKATDQTQPLHRLDRPPGRQWSYPILIPFIPVSAQTLGVEGLRPNPRAQ